MLSDRNIALVVLARFVSRVGGSAAFFVGVWGMAAYTFHQPASTLAWMMAGMSLSEIAGSMVAGVFIDRLGPRKVLIVAEMLTLPVAVTLMFVQSFAVFVPLAWLFGFVGAPTFTAGASFAPYLSSDNERLQKINATVEGAGSLAFIIGPALGALVVQAWGAPSVFGLMAAASAIAAIAAWFVVIEVPVRRRESGHHPFREFTNGLRVSYSVPALRYTILTGSLVWFGFGAFGALEPLFYRDVLNVGVQWIGWMNTMFGLGLVCGAVLLSRLPKRMISAPGLGVMAALAGLGAIAYVGSTNLWVVAFGSVVWGVVIGATEPLLRTLLHLNSPHEYVGRVVGTAQYHKNAGELLPLAVAPTLALAFGVQATLIAGGVLVAIIALATLPIAFSVDRRGLRAVRVLPTAPEDEVIARLGDKGV
ncbi:MAG: MFS transporter [Coriobacteriia bacterium]|nr:MFS transporter [Coriobacteriia bacterium]